MFANRDSGHSEKESGHKPMKKWHVKFRNDKGIATKTLQGKSVADIKKQVADLGGKFISADSMGKLHEAAEPSMKKAKAAYAKFEAAFTTLFPKFDSNKHDGWPEEMLVGPDGVHYMSYARKPGGTSWFKIDGDSVTKIKGTAVPDDAEGIDEVFVV